MARRRAAHQAMVGLHMSCEGPKLNASQNACKAREPWTGKSCFRQHIIDKAILRLQNALQNSASEASNLVSTKKPLRPFSRGKTQQQLLRMGNPEFIVSCTPCCSTRKPLSLLISEDLWILPSSPNHCSVFRTVAGEYKTLQLLRNHEWA